MHLQHLIQICLRMSLKTVKSKIRSVKRTHTVTKAMEAVSAVKMRKSQERAFAGRPYALSALRILTRASASSEAAALPYFEKRPVSRVCYIVLTSDKGLAGSLNSAVLKHGLRTVSGEGLPKEAYRFITIGKKAADYWRAREFTVAESAPNDSDVVPMETLKSIIATVTDAYLAREYDEVRILYSNFLSTFSQEAVERVLLPINSEEFRRVALGIVPVAGKFADVPVVQTRTSSYTLEPEGSDVLRELVPHVLCAYLYHAFLEAKASEHSARMVAMKNASDKARDMGKDLSRKFNKERQALITREVSEITGGIEAMA